ncbi:MAG TPA: hypothetical protein VNO52_16600 [Methylomirabilota bacterium]|nr:hypothetical protein [Methylomirabilota bacterium]
MTENGANLRSVTWHDGHQAVVGNRGRILTSTNTFQWAPRVSRTLENLLGVRWIDGTFLTIGNLGAVLPSRWLNGARLAVQRLAPGPWLRLFHRGRTRRMHGLQGSIDLRDWTDRFEFSNTQEATLSLDAEAMDHAQRFYRVGTE